MLFVLFYHIILSRLSQAQARAPGGHVLRACLFGTESCTRGKSARLDLLHQNVYHDAGLRLIPLFDFSLFSFVPSRLQTPSTPGISLIFQPSPRFIRFELG